MCLPLDLLLSGGVVVVGDGGGAGCRVEGGVPAEVTRRGRSRAARRRRAGGGARQRGGAAPAGGGDARGGRVWGGQAARGGRRRDAGERRSTPDFTPAGEPEKLRVGAVAKIRKGFAGQLCETTKRRDEEEERPRPIYMLVMSLQYRL